MSKRKQYTPEEKAEFVKNNMKVTFWMDKNTLLDFDKICKTKKATRKEGIIKLMERFVKKNAHLLGDDDK